ncbi:hypothetical protein SAMN05444287_0534 [Octadecabacter temperatus]|uniref:Uncharacterized protein n=1 Tax=Octadecabacter temperatus TaxID=1458307 RepID=A0A0K0Y3C5_9RHOB|nr:hypothetical protein [Octadecabacter temperatus]AKS45440.1 hypothetical protein OSB_08810 [Octadecabacter temperatus]SIN92962.1 hypothetical protein SAMN05444287_0534 [Octadecabacter temperatus]
MSSGDIERIFSTVQTRWGLRGDPLLWDAIKQRMILRGLPDTADQFAAQLAQDYFEIVGQHLDESDDFVGVTTLRRENGGMSNGMVSPKAWREGLMPLLLSRFNENV